MQKIGFRFGIKKVEQEVLIQNTRLSVHQLFIFLIQKENLF